MQWTYETHGILQGMRFASAAEEALEHYSPKASAPEI